MQNIVIGVALAVPLLLIAWFASRLFRLRRFGWAAVAGIVAIGGLCAGAYLQTWPEGSLPFAIGVLLSVVVLAPVAVLAIVSFVRPSTWRPTTAEDDRRRRRAHEFPNG